MTDQKILYLDMDGVLCNFEKALYNLFPHILDMPEGSEERAKEVDRCCESEKGHRIFRDLELVPGAIWAYKQLIKHYFVHILSTAMWGVPHSFMDKRLWVEKNLGPDAFKRLNLSHNKGLFRGDYLIDDRLKNGVEWFQGEHIHFGQPDFRTWLQTICYLSKKDGWEMEEPPEELKTYFSKGHHIAKLNVP